MSNFRQAREYVSIYKKMYSRGWINEFGGGISCRQNDDVYAVPSSKEWKFDVNDVQLYFHEGKMNDFQTDLCAALIKSPFEKFSAKSILHTHSVNSIVVADWIGRHVDHITWSGFESIKNIFDREKNSYLKPNDTVKLPIIDNKEDLEEAMNDAWAKFPASSAVLIRGHGFFVWDRSLDSAFKQCLAYEQLFEIDVKSGRDQFNSVHRQ